MTLDCITQPHQHLSATLQSGVLTLALQRPEYKNALYSDLYLALVHALEQADASPEVSCLILRGLGQDFTAGNDMQDFLKFFKMDLGQQKAGDLPPFLLIKAVAKFSKPILVAVKGVAIGIGVTLLLHVDMAFADDTAVFQMPFVSLGLSPEGGISKLMVERIGYGPTAELLFTARKFDKTTAENLGLINRLPADVDVYDHVSALAQNLTCLPLASLKQSKAMMKHQLAEILRYIDNEAEIFIKRVQSVEAREAVQAFIEKRKPDFSQFNHSHHS